MNSKLKKILITVILICIAVMYLIFANSNMFLRKYTTLEAALKVNSIDPKKIIGILEQRNVKMITYRGGSKFIFMDENNKYYANRTNENFIFMDNFKNHEIMIIEENEKIIIYISGPFSSKDAIVNDNFNSEFSYCKIEFHENFLRKWLLVLDELPEDYKIIIDGESIDIKI